MDVNQKKKLFKWFGFGIILFVLLLVVLFLFGVNVLNFPFKPTLPPVGAIIDFSPLYNLAFWYLSFRILILIGEKIILRSEAILDVETPKEAKSSDS